jgi:UDP-N-acetylglucosamine transferase subunit ALG13
MIVVSVGTNEARFDRLLEWVSGIELEDDLVVQHGPSTVRPPDSRCVPYLPYEDLVELVRESRAFVTHAGVGSIMMALFSGRRPVVVPRLKRFGEAVDDHQVSLARRLQAEGLVTHVESVEALERALAHGSHEVAHMGGATALQRELHEYLAGLSRP